MTAFAPEADLAIPARRVDAIGAGLSYTTLIRTTPLDFDLRQPPPTLTRALQLVSRATHYAFYLLLVTLPATGMAALYINSEAGDLHLLLKNVLLILIAAHIAGTLTHAFILKDGVIRRMLPRL